MHKNYGKIFHIDKEESEWILNGICYIQEKIDWANLSVWMEDWEIFVGSRTQVVWTDKIKQWFRWAVEYINNHQGIKDLFKSLSSEYSNIRLYWEWLVPHTITNYNPEAYNHFYLYDIEINDERIDIEKVNDLAIIYNIHHPFLFGKINSPTKADLDKFSWVSKIWPNGEGIVIKNPKFINKFGNFSYAKMVTEEFKEDNWVIFGNNTKTDTEQDVVARYLDWERVKKIMNKIEQNEWVNIEKKHIWMILWMVRYDIITEEANNISKYWIVDFRRLEWLILKKTKLLVLNYFDGWQTSVAFDNK